MFTLNIEQAMAARDVAGAFMAELGARDERVVVVNADLTRSSRTRDFSKQFPDRSYNVGIAEQNQASFAAGLAQEGFIPYVFSFAPFLSMRACEQVRTDVCYGNLPVRFVGSGAGYSNGISGATHCGLEDAAIMSSFARMTVLEPGDPFMVAKMLEASISWDGPIYIRLGREAANSIYGAEYDYQIGKALIPREGDDGAFIVTGVTVQHAMTAAKMLEDELGVHIRVVDMHTIKPLDVDAVLAAAKTGRVVVAHDHNIIGGLGGLVGTAIAEAGIACKFKILGCPDHFVPIANTDCLYALNGYDAKGMATQMKAFL